MNRDFAKRYTVITGVVTNQVLSANPCVIKKILVYSVGTTATLAVADHASSAASPFYSWASADGVKDHELNMRLANGLTITTTGTVGRIIIIWDEAV